MSQKDAPQLEIITDPIASAKAAGLRHVSDTKPGIQRQRKSDTFVYIGTDGQPITDEKELQRIKSLAIPPAWEEVWICPQANGHIQATARDAKGRKQYRYHPRWREVRDETKFGRMIAFAQALPTIRRRVEEDLQLSGMPREKILATIVRLLETTFIRIGNEEYARANKSYGLTTMKNRHVEVSGSTLRFRFRGKSGKYHSIKLTNPRLSRIVKRCQSLPGQDLFQYLDENGEPQSIGSSDVNDYLREITGEDFTAKDFRTWAGTVLAAQALVEFDEYESETQAKRNIVEAVLAVANRLGNTPAVCRKCYIHPTILDTYLDRSLQQALKGIAATRNGDSLGLRAEEKAVVKLLQQCSALAA
jgi:DNA topoisomerase I